MKKPLFNTLMLLMTLAVIMQRVLTPLVTPPLIVHADGTLEICSWHGGISQPLLISLDGERLDAPSSPSPCPACTASAAVTLATELDAPLPASNLQPLLLVSSALPFFSAEGLPPVRAPPTV